MNPMLLRGLVALVSAVVLFSGSLIPGKERGCGSPG